MRRSLWWGHITGLPLHELYVPHCPLQSGKRFGARRAKTMFLSVSARYYGPCHRVSTQIRVLLGSYVSGGLLCQACLLYWTLASFAVLRRLTQKALQYWEIVTQLGRLLTGRLQ